MIKLLENKPVVDQSLPMTMKTEIIVNMDQSSFDLISKKTPGEYILINKTYKWFTKDISLMKLSGFKVKITHSEKIFQ